MPIPLPRPEGVALVLVVRKSIGRRCVVVGVRGYKVGVSVVTMVVVRNRDVQHSFSATSSHPYLHGPVA